ncbi:unnamed protein product [Haemonchus placei]|uniref:Secreted protein n=1 Tax=Haemonchus placei TaxID=6290 RepID=A0A0N4VYJ5_HAEPC|nr:unnamed protein product [Haemonchus placei]
MILKSSEELGFRHFFALCSLSVNTEQNMACTTPVSGRKSRSIFQLTCAADAFICLRLGVLLFRAAPNSQVLGLTTVLIDGDKTSRMESAAPQFPPTTPTTNPV